MSKKDDDSLSADAALAVEHTPERAADQLAHLGGELDEIDSFDATGLDDGSVLPDNYDPLNPAPAASPDDDDDDGDKDDADDDSKDDAPAADDADGDDDADSEKDADDADAVDDDEGKDNDEADADGEEDDDDEVKPAAKGIPKHRFDEVNERRKSAEAENTRLKAEIEAGKPPAKEEDPFDIDGAEKEYMNLMLDGDTDAALAKRKVIRAAEKAEWQSETRTATKTDIDVDSQNSQLLSLSQEAQKMFDVFDPDSDNYDQPMLNKVMTFMRGYEASGEMTRSDAFIAGLADVVEMYDLMPDENDPEPEIDPGKPPPKVDKSKKALAKKAHVPASTAGTGSADTGAVVPDVDNMTDEELDALPPKMLARMRGDIL